MTNNTNNAANVIDTSKPWTCPGCGRLMAAGLHAWLPVLCHGCRKSDPVKPRDVMLYALGVLLRDNGGKVPEGRTDVSVGERTVRVYGKSAVKTNVSVQFVLDAATGYGADVGPKSGKLGKLYTYTP